MALRLECWKKSIMGVERRSEVYWRWSCDLRNSGGLCDGGWVVGYLVIGGMEVVICSIEGAGVMAWMEAYLQE